MSCWSHSELPISTSGYPTSTRLPTGSPRCRTRDSSGHLPWLPRSGARPSPRGSKPARYSTIRGCGGPFFPRPGGSPTRGPARGWWRGSPAAAELGGVRLYSPERVDSFLALREDPYVVDEVIGKAAIMSWSGFRMGSDHPNREAVIGTSAHVLSPHGAGGSVTWADVDQEFSAAICHNRMFSADPDHPD